MERPSAHLTPIEGNKDVPFDIKKIYYLIKVPENTISVTTPYEKELIILDDPAKGLYIGFMIWREMYVFSQGSILVVLASEYYNVEDYIRGYRVYCEMAQEYFKNGQ